MISERAAGVKETDAVRQALVFVCLSARASGESPPVSYDEIVSRLAYSGRGRLIPPAVLKGR